MIRALRRRHFWIMVALALILPALFAAALWLRPGLPKPDPAAPNVSPITDQAAPVIED